MLEKGTLELAMEAKCCCVPSWPSRSICSKEGSTVLTYSTCLSLQLRGRNGCPKTLFHFGLDQSSTTFMHMLLGRIADLLASELMKCGRVSFHYCSGGTVQSIKCWRLGLGLHRLPFKPSTFEMSPTSIWTRSLWVLWWPLKRSCNSLALSGLVL